MLLDETEAIARAMPGLAKALSAASLMDLESSGGAAVAALFRQHGDPGFLVPRDLGGTGGSLLDMGRILRVVGARCPSLSIMMTMHHHTVASFSHGGITMRASRDLQRSVANDRALVASAFSEGRRGADVLESSVSCTREMGAGYRITGVKKPCSMTHHADFFVVGVAMRSEGEAPERGMALVDRRLAGVSTSDFWPSEILAAADCHAVTFDGVTVATDCVLAPGGGADGSRGRLAVTYGEIALSCLFQVLVSASYLGMASRVCEVVLQRRSGTAAERVEILSGLETAALSIYRLADVLETRKFSGYLLAQSMLVSLNASAQIARAVALSIKVLGASFLASRESQYLALATRCLDFHPPSSQVREEIVEGCYTDVV